jgi:hypothetical protein
MEPEFVAEGLASLDDSALFPHIDAIVSRLQDENAKRASPQAALRPTVDPPIPFAARSLSYEESDAALAKRLHEESVAARAASACAAATAAPRAEQTPKEAMTDTIFCFFSSMPASERDQLDIPDEIRDLFGLGKRCSTHDADAAVAAALAAADYENVPDPFRLQVDPEFERQSVEVQFATHGAPLPTQDPMDPRANTGDIRQDCDDLGEVLDDNGTRCFVPCFREPHHAPLSAGMSPVAADGALAAAYKLSREFNYAPGFLEPEPERLSSLLDRLSTLYPQQDRASLRDLLAAAGFSTRNLDALVRRIFPGQGVHNTMPELAPPPLVRSLAAAQDAYRVKHSLCMRMEPTWRAELTNSPIGYRRARWEGELIRRWRLWVGCYLPKSYVDAAIIRPKGGRKLTHAADGEIVIVPHQPHHHHHNNALQETKQQQGRRPQMEAPAYPRPVDDPHNKDDRDEPVRWRPRHLPAIHDGSPRDDEDKADAGAVAVAAAVASAGGHGSGGDSDLSDADGVEAAADAEMNYDSAVKQLQEQAQSLQAAASRAFAVNIDTRFSEDEFSVSDIANCFNNFPVLESLLAARLPRRLLPYPARRAAPRIFQWDLEALALRANVYRAMTSSSLHRRAVTPAADKERHRTLTQQQTFYEALRAIRTLLNSEFGRVDIDRSARVDLHGFTMHHAAAAVKFFVRRFEMLARTQPVARVLQFCVGVGKHSEGAAALPTAVLGELRKIGVRMEDRWEPSSGIIAVPMNEVIESVRKMLEKKDRDAQRLHAPIAFPGL